MLVDRERFLVLAGAIASATACTRTTEVPTADLPILPPVASSAPEAPRVVAQPPTPPTLAGASSASSSSLGDPVVSPSACEQDNDTGTVDCSKWKGRKLGGPACEGLEGTCDLLAKSYAYRPKAAAAAAACLSKLGAGACDIRARNRCYLEGVKAACPEPQYEARCQGKIDMCRAANVRVQYTKEECVKAMSAQHERDREWAISQMGPSSEGKCQLMYTVF